MGRKSGHRKKALPMNKLFFRLPTSMADRQISFAIFGDTCLVRSKRVSTDNKRSFWYCTHRTVSVTLHHTIRRRCHNTRWQSTPTPTMRISPLILLVDAAGAFVGHRPQKRSRPKSSPSRTIPTTTSLLAPSRPAYQSTSSLSSAGASSVLSREEIARYSRHLVLSDVGVAGQAALKNASVLVIGAGGLGSPCLLYLAAAGVGHVGIVDADVVDESNLQRQIIHGTSTVNVSKCASAQQRMLDINPHVQVRTYEQEFTSETAISILGQGFSADKPYDIVVDGSDNFPTKYLIK